MLAGDLISANCLSESTYPFVPSRPRHWRGVQVAMTRWILSLSRSSEKSSAANKPILYSHGLPPGHAHMSGNRGVARHAINSEVMTSRLALDGGADRGADEIVAR
jgi:hypothetical protein